MNKKDAPKLASFYCIYKMVHIIYDTYDYNGKRVVVRKNVRSINGNLIDKNKNWVVTSFDNNIPKSKKTLTATIATPNGNEGSRAVTPDVSIGKDKNNLFNDNTRTKEFKEWFGDWEKTIKFANSFIQFKNKYNGKEYTTTDDFRRVQEESRRLSEEDVQRYHSSDRTDEFKRRLGAVYEGLLSRSGSTGFTFRTDLTHKTSTFKLGEVNPKLFHDIFEVNRRYLPNGELVDLHDDYSECKCFITDDGLAGFAIEPDGNLISAFSLNPSDKKGFLYAIKDFIREEGATHLDCYNSNRQNLEFIYAKTIGFYPASRMDYNMEYDHDNIAKNHGYPQISFMVNHKVAVKEFNKDQYDEAEQYQKKQLDNVSQVVDKNGEPLVVYHWSQGGINTFDLEKARTTSEVQGFFFMGDPVSSKEYGDTKYGVYLNMRNPYIVDTHEKMKFAYPDLSKTDDGIRVREMLQEMGYDGIIRKAEYTENESDEYIVFSPIYQKMNKKTFFFDLMRY